MQIDETFSYLIMPIGMTDRAVIITLIAGLAFIVALAALSCIGYWCTLRKMGRHDFATFVPVYLDWELCRGAGFSPGLAAAYLVFTLLAGVFAALASIVAPFAVGTMQVQQLTTTFMANGMMYKVDAHGLASLVTLLQPMFEFLAIVGGVLALVQIVLYFYMCYGISRSFGHSVPFMLGLAFLPLIFFLVLGCSGSQRYRGPALDKRGEKMSSSQWSSLVKARYEVFGSNAPLALAIIAMIMDASIILMPVGVILAITALVRNKDERGKPCNAGKRRVAKFAAIFALIMAAAIVAGIVWLVTRTTMI